LAQVQNTPAQVGKFGMKAFSFIRGIFKVKDAGDTVERIEPACGHWWESVVPEHQPEHLRVTLESDHGSRAHKGNQPFRPEGEQQPLPKPVSSGRPDNFSQELGQGSGCTSRMDGSWEECHVHGACLLAHALKFFSIENGNLTTAQGRVCKVAPGAKPNSILLGNGMIEMISDALLQLKTTSGGLAYFQRANLPPRDTLVKLQGYWIHRGRYLGQPQTITIDGAMWTVGGEEASQGILQMRDGAVFLGDLKIRIQSSGKMHLTSPSGRVEKFISQRKVSRMHIIAE